MTKVFEIMFDNHKPEQGSLLISEPFMLDPEFERSVIMLCEHSEEGSVGLILNHRSHLYISDILDNIQDQKFPIYIGGPVQSSSLYFIHTIDHMLPGGTHIVDDIFFGGNFDKLLILLQEDKIKTEELKFFLGYSGWSPNQLKNEIDHNSWIVHHTFPTALAFVIDGEDLWKQALINLGPKYAHVANFPKHPYLN